MKTSAEETSSAPGSRLSERGRRRAIVAAGLTALLGAGVWLLIGQSASYSKLLHAVEHSNPGWLVLSLGGSGIAYFGYALLYQAVTHVEEGPRPPFRLALRMAVVVFGSAVVATAAGRVGSEYWSLRRMEEKAPRAWARVLALNTAIWGVLATLTAIGAVVLLAGGPHRAPFWVSVAWLIVLPVCAAPALYFSSHRFHAMTLERTGGRLRRSWTAIVHSLVILRRVFLHPGERTRGWSGGLLYWGGQLVVVWGALHAFGVQLDYGRLLIGYTTGYAATILPLPAAGAGGVDAASVYALTLVGVPLGAALLATLVARIFTYWLPLAIAIASVRLIRRLGSDLAQVPRRAEGSRTGGR